MGPCGCRGWSLGKCGEVAGRDFFLLAGAVEQRKATSYQTLVRRPQASALQSLGFFVSKV